MRVAVSGYYGFANAGDEAVLAGMLRALRRAGGIVTDDVTVLSGDPSSTSNEHGVRAVPRASMSQVKEAIRSADFLISGGGSLLQDVTSVRSLAYYLWVIALARRLRRPVAVYAQGIGPLRRPISRIMARRALSKVAALTVRDKGSLRLLGDIGVGRSDIRVTADPAFALERPDIRPERPSAPPSVGIAPRPWPGFDAASVTADTARALHSAGFLVELIPMQDPRDEELCMEASRMAAGAATHTPCRGHHAGALAACGRVDVLIGMRLHALIMGAICGAGLVGVSYDPKVAEFLGGLGMADAVVELPDAGPERLAVAAKEALERRDAASSRLSAAVEERRAEAFANAGYILECVNRIGVER